MFKYSIFKYVFTRLPHHRQDVTQSIFKQSKAGLNWEFFLDCYTKVKEPSLLYYLLIVRERKDGFMSFLRTLEQRKQSCPQFDLPSSFPMMITPLHHAPQHTHTNICVCVCVCVYRYIYDDHSRLLLIYVFAIINSITTV